MAEGAISKLGNFLGVNKLGQGIAATTRVLTGEVGRDIQRQNQNSMQVGKLVYAAKQEKDPTKRARLLQLAKGLGTGTSATEIDPNLNLSNREILGSAANVGLNILTPGAFKGGAGAVIGKNAALGAGFGLASGMEKGRSAKGIAGSITAGALTGAALGTGAVAFRGLKNLFTKKLPPVLMNKAVKPALNDLRKNVKFGTETLGKELLDEGVKGGPKRLLEIADDKLNIYEDQLQSVLSATDDLYQRERMGHLALPAGATPLGSRTGGNTISVLDPSKTFGRGSEGKFKRVFTQQGSVIGSRNIPVAGRPTSVGQKQSLEGSTLISRNQIARYLKELVVNKKSTPGLRQSVGQIEGVFNELPEQMTLSQANQIKRRIYDELRDPAFKLDAKLGIKGQAMKAIAHGLKSEIENSVGGNVVRDINRKLSIYGRLENSVVDYMARSLKNNSFTLTDGLLLTAGAAGSLFNPDQQTKPLGLFLSLAAIIGRHNSPALNTYAAQGLSKLGEMGGGKIGQTVSGAVRRGALNLP